MYSILKIKRQDGTLRINVFPPAHIVWHKKKIYNYAQDPVFVHQKKILK